MAARGSNVIAGVVAGCDGPGIPGKGVFLRPMEVIVLFAARLKLLRHASLRFCKVNPAEIIGVLRVDGRSRGRAAASAGLRPTGNAVKQGGNKNNTPYHLHSAPHLSDGFAQRRLCLAAGFVNSGPPSR